MAGAFRKFVVGCLAVAGFLMLCVAVLFGAYVAWGVRANTRAEHDASALCSGIHVGDGTESVLAKAAASEPPPRTMQGQTEIHFMYYGMIFSARECLVSTSQGRVTATHVVVHDDD